MVYVVFTKHDMRVSSFMEIETNTKNFWEFDNPDNYASAVFDSVDFDPNYDLADYRLDVDSGEIILDPMEDEVEYVDLETGEKTTITTSDIEAMVSEKVRNQVEAVLSEMMKSERSDLLIATKA